jgi:hypothetical protein
LSQFQGTFKRYEKKYLLTEAKYKLLKQRLQNKLAIDKFGRSNICNIYFDTPDRLLIRNSLEKPIYKEKLRLRSYGIPSEGDMVFVELKKKFNGIVYKRREKMELSMAERYLYDLETVSKSSQITREIDWVLQFYKGIAPSMYISYNRIAMYGLQDKELRITFDSNILWREEELWLECGAWGNLLLEEGCRLMEVKIPGAMPLWLSHLLDELEIFPTSLSKYGKGYEQSELIKKNERIKGVIKYA